MEEQAGSIPAMDISGRKRGFMVPAGFEERLRSR
jgi:hypothetical protein